MSEFVCAGGADAACETLAAQRGRGAALDASYAVGTWLSVANRELPCPLMAAMIS
jgi:hypothetical protein